MKVINLIDSTLSDIIYDSITFSDQQPHIRIHQNVPNNVKIITRLSLPQDLLMLLYTTDALRRNGATHIEVIISYLMAARMDRVMNEGEPLSLKVISKILNDMNYSKVSIFDPHSEVSLALINHCESISNYKFVSLSLQDFYKAKDISKDAMLISPDSGALKKIYKLATQLNLPYVVECSKKRDTLTGKLSGFSANVHDLSDKDCFIIDDICDGGGTFIGLADVLRSKNAKSVNLILTHGIFSKGISLQGINKIYTTNSFKDIPINDTLHCFNVCTQIF